MNHTTRNIFKRPSGADLMTIVRGALEAAGMTLTQEVTSTSSHVMAMADTKGESGVQVRVELARSRLGAAFGGPIWHAEVMADIHGGPVTGLAENVDAEDAIADALAVAAKLIKGRLG